MRSRTAVSAFLLVCSSPGLFAGSGPSPESSAATIHLTATLNERLSLGSPTTAVHFVVAPQNTARADQPLMITTSWNLDASRSAVVVRAYFSGPDRSLTAEESTPAADALSGSEILVRTATGTPREFTSLATAGGQAAAAAGLEIFRQPLHPHVNDLASRTDAVELQLSLKNHANVSSGHYEGDLTLVAQAY